MDEKPLDTLNMIPFVDIMLVLLTIVLTTSSFIATGRLQLNLPNASQSMPEQKEDHVIEIATDGTISLDSRIQTKDGLESELAHLGPESSFVVRADRDIRFQLFIDVADALRQHNFTKVSIQTETRS